MEVVEISCELVGLWDDGTGVCGGVVRWNDKDVG